MVIVSVGYKNYCNQSGLGSVGYKIRVFGFLAKLVQDVSSICLKMLGLRNFMCVAFRFDDAVEIFSVYDFATRVRVHL